MIVVRPHQFLGLTLLLLILISLPGCSDDPAKPGPEVDPQLFGRVTDADGNPVEGAKVALVLGIDGIDLPGWEDPKKAALQTSIRFAFAEVSVARAEILDYLRRPVRTLFDGVITAGVHEFVWDGTDRYGALIPLGGYWAVVTIESEDESEEPQVFEHFLFLYSDVRSELPDRAHAITDSKGNFSIPIDLLPLGRELTVTNESGEEVSVEEISHRVHFFAIGEDGTQVDRYVTIADPARSRRVDVALPGL